MAAKKKPARVKLPGVVMWAWKWRRWKQPCNIVRAKRTEIGEIFGAPRHDGKPVRVRIVDENQLRSLVAAAAKGVG